MRIFPQTIRAASAAFTMVEVAISLAVIGVALVAIIGVLPLGMNVQRENREGTVINQDATVFLQAIRGGTRGLDDLTNYVYAITNYWTQYDGKGVVTAGGGGINNGYSYNGYSIGASWNPSVGYFPLTNGLRIISLLSTPQFTDDFGNPTNNLYSGGYSNHIVAYVRAISGSAVDKPPQDNPIIQQDAFGYRLLCVNALSAADTNQFDVTVFTNGPTPYFQALAANLHELRLTFFWPVLPNGRVGNGRQTYRSLIAGQVVFDATNGTYFYDSQNFANSP